MFPSSSRRAESRTVMLGRDYVSILTFHKMFSSRHVLLFDKQRFFLCRIENSTQLMLHEMEPIVKLFKNCFQKLLNQVWINSSVQWHFDFATAKRLRWKIFLSLVRSPNRRLLWYKKYAQYAVNNYYAFHSITLTIKMPHIISNYSTRTSIDQFPDLHKPKLKLMFTTLTKINADVHNRPVWACHLFWNETLYKSAYMS